MLHVTELASSDSYCGNTNEHCGPGCQAGFGECHLGAADSSTSRQHSSVGSDITDAGNRVAASVVVDAFKAMSEHPQTTGEAAQSLYASTCSRKSALATATGTAGNGSVVSLSREYIRTFTGDGSVSDAAWPPKEEWLSFDDFWECNKPRMEDSCQRIGVNLSLNSDQEIENIRAAIEALASDTKLDKTFIAAIMMQESGGCTRVQTTANSHPNPGLMQSHNGEGTCHDRPKGPCPKEDIFQMITDGVAGTSDGDGLKQCFEKSEGGQGPNPDEATRYYQAARRYNSGSVSPDGDLGQGTTATNCYCSDVANRLIGWNSGNSMCILE